MSYSQEQITAALLLFDKTGSPAKVKELLGYPSIAMLYLWKERYPDLYKRQGKQWTHAPLDLKMSAIRRCYYDGESIESVSRDIGYTVAAIQYWKRKYAKAHFILLRTPYKPIANSAVFGSILFNALFHPGYSLAYAAKSQVDAE